MSRREPRPADPSLELARGAVTLLVDALIEVTDLTHRTHARFAAGTYAALRLVPGLDRPVAVVECVQGAVTSAAYGAVRAGVAAGGNLLAGAFSAWSRLAGADLGRGGR